MKPYPRYKPTGLAWLPSVPEHWEVVKNRSFLRESCVLLPETKAQLLSVSQYDGVTPFPEDRKERVETLEGYKVVDKNDLVMNIMLAWNGSSGVSAHQGVVSPAYAVFKILDGANPRFIHYLFRSDCICDYFKAFSTGVVDSRLRLYPQVLARMWSPLPPLTEQDRIVRYLDEKTAAIDELVRAKEREIELLRERKQALVSAAVTGGLDLATERKDSGVPWIGTIPKEWKIIPLKRIAKLNPNCVLPENGKEQVLVSFAPMECVRFDSLEHREAPLSNLNSSYSCFNEGDIAIAKVTPCFENGNCCIMTNLANGFCFGSSELFCLRPNSMADKRFLLYLFRNAAFINGGCQTMSGTGGLKRVSSEYFRDTPIPLPPLPEQERIVAHLDSACSELDAAEAAIRKQIALLQELRTRLVSDAVTGAVEV